MDLFKLLGTITIKNSDAIQALDQTSKKGQETESKLSKGFSAIGKGAAVVGKAVATGMMMAGTAVVGLVTNATSAYAQYEQLVGGVDTLFKESSAKVQAYAEQAYQTAGMSANEYMETVTSFSASLLQSLGGDTEEAADKADVAIRDMSDNANKMGTSMQSIQNAYQGFAKQNYTMLDNLKLGYGGTKEEMQRLLADAEKLSGQEFDISSYADVVDAIHIIQTEMGITGTTAAEASGTITGSMNSVKGAWTNLVTAMASDNLPLDEYINKFTDSATTMVSNMLPRIQKALGGVVQLVDKLAPVIIGAIPELFSQLLPSIIESATGLLNVVVSILPDLVNMLVGMIPAFVDGVVQIVNAIIESLPQIMESLVAALPTLIPILVDALVSIVVTLCEVLPQIIQPIIDHLPEIIISIVGALMDNLPILIEGLIALTMGIVSALPQIMLAILDALPTILTMIVDGLFNSLGVLIDGLGNMAKQIIPAILSYYADLPSKFFDIFKSAFSNVRKAFEKTGEFFGKIRENIQKPFLSITSWFKDKFTEAWSAVKNVFSTGGKIFDGIKDGIANVFTTIVNGIIGGINKVIAVPFNAINNVLAKIRDVEIMGLSPFTWVTTFDVPQIPLLEWNADAMRNPRIFDEPTIYGYNPGTGTFQGVGEAGSEVVSGTNTLMNMISSAVASQNAGLIDVLYKILEAILNMDENMGGNLREALDGVSFDVNKREFARLVKGVT